MTWLLVVGPFLVVGMIVVFIAFYGGASGAREAYLTRGGKAFAIIIAVLYIGLGIAIPAVVIANREEAEGGVGSLRTTDISSQDELGKTLFIENCKSCHTLAAVQAHGVTGPDLDDLAPLDKQRVRAAIRRGGTGTGRMPPGLLDGADADAVATYVSTVAGN